MRQVPVALIAGQLIDLHDTDCCHNSSNCKNVKQVETTRDFSTYSQKNKAIRTGEPALVNPIICQVCQKLSHIADNFSAMRIISPAMWIFPHLCEFHFHKVDNSPGRWVIIRSLQICIDCKCLNPGS